MKIHFRILLFLTFLIWFGGIYFNYLIYILPESIVLSPFVSNCYSLVCHQEKEKLILVEGIKANVCARCNGIYFALFLFAFINMFKEISVKPSIKYLVIFSLPMLLDVILYSTGIYNYSKPVAFFSGSLFGCIVFVYFYRGLQNLFVELDQRKNTK